MDITVVGMGRVGVVAAACMASEGHNVTGVDTDTAKVESLRAGTVPFHERGLTELVAAGLGMGGLRFVEEIPSNSHTIVVAVGTPRRADGKPDLSQVEQVLQEVLETTEPNTAVVMKSTVPPGFGGAWAVRFHDRGIDYIACPEFLREGYGVHDWRFPSRVVMGIDTPIATGWVPLCLHGSDRPPTLLTSTTSAEMVKYASNAFLATRVSFINEMASVCEAVGADIEDVSQGLTMDPRMGSAMRAGLGYGGSCLPKDLDTLCGRTSQYDVRTPLLDVVSKINGAQLYLPLRAIWRRFQLEDCPQMAVLGLAFKPGTNTVWNAPALKIVEQLVRGGAYVSVYDPEAMPDAREQLPEPVRFADSIEDAIHGAQAVVLATEWEEFRCADWQTLATSMRPPRFFFDGRNTLDPQEMRALGFDYMCVGRP